MDVKDKKPKTNYGETPLKLAARYGHKELVCYFKSI